MEDIPHKFPIVFEEHSGPSNFVRRLIADVVQKTLAFTTKIYPVTGCHDCTGPSKGRNMKAPISLMTKPERRSVLSDSTCVKSVTRRGGNIENIPMTT